MRYARTPTMEVSENAPIWGWHATTGDCLGHGDDRTTETNFVSLSEL